MSTTNYGNQSYNGKKPLRPFPLPSANHSPATSAACDGSKVSDKGKEPARVSRFNQAGPSNIDGSSSLYPDLSTFVRILSPQCSYSNVVPQSHNYYNDGINDVFSSLVGFLNGSRPWYSEENGMTNSYMAAPHMHPVNPFNGNHVPSPYVVPFDVHRYPTRPQAQYLSGPSYAVARPELEASQPQQSDFPSSIDDLRARLRKQIEYYFSSTNLRTDYYLKNLMDGCGWVSINLIMKFRKVVALLKEKDVKMQSASIFDLLQVEGRPLSNDQQFVLNSVRPSDTVEVQGDRVRKRHNWDKWVTIPPSIK